MTDFSNITLSYSTPEGEQGHNLRFLGFPGGERHVWISPGLLHDAEKYTIDARIYSSDGVMDLLMLNDALRRVVGDRAIINLNLPYLPYARQDRVTVAGEPLSLKVFASLINGMGFDKVTVADPHSSVGIALLDRVQIETPDQSIEAILALPQFAQGVALVAPDAGAHKRVQDLASRLGVPVVLCVKVRDTATGKLSKPQVLGDAGLIPAVPLLVVDDICDGGGTFVGLIQMLSALTDQDISLFTTHGLYTKGLEPLSSYHSLFTAYPRDQNLWARCGNYWLVEVSEVALRQSSDSEQRIVETA